MVGTGVKLGVVSLHKNNGSKDEPYASQESDG